MDSRDVMSGEAWRSFCRRMSAVGDRILADDFPTDPHERAEGYRHLANQVACWLTYAIGHTDPEHPQFFRSSDLVYQWGGPNANQVTRRARISGDGTYRISGNMGACEEFVLQVKLGGTQSDGADIATELSASDLGIGPDDDFEIVLAPEERIGQDDPTSAHHVRLDPDATFVHIRDYYFGWQPLEPATFVIERLDTQGAHAAPLTGKRVAAILDDAASEIEHSMVFWNEFQARMRSGQALNQFGVPIPAGRGVQDILYSHAFVALKNDDALIVEIDPSGAAWWDIQLYNRVWYEALDFANRATSLNHRLAHRSADGRVRVVISPTDPGVANWIDTEGRPEVLATVRWFRPVEGRTVNVQQVPITDVAGRLPVETPLVDPYARRREIAQRSAHAAWRYRS